MKNLFLFPIRLAGFAVKCVALVAALNLVLAPLMPGQTALWQRECESCAQWQQRCAVLEEDCARLQEALDAEYSLLRRVDLQLLPGLGMEWLSIRGFSFWGDVSRSHYEAYPEGASETIWVSGLMACSLTTIERDCTG